MTATVYDFHDNPTARRRWSDMEQFHNLRALGLVPNVPPAELRADTAPCELSASFIPIDAGWPDFMAPEKDGA